MSVFLVFQWEQAENLLEYFKRREVAEQHEARVTMPEYRLDWA